MNCRKRYRVVRVAVALAVATILTVAFLPQLALAISQRWYLTDTASATEYVMNRGAAGGSSAPITVAALGSEIWVADEAASLPVTFPSGDWPGQITATPDSNTHEATVDIGSWDGGTFTSAGTSGTMTFQVKGTPETLPFTITGASAINISVGNWLALRFNNNIESKPIDVATDGTSYVDSPSTDPGYPSPWESYDDASQSNVWGTGVNPYTGATQTAYMYGTGFTASTNYVVAYYDASALNGGWNQTTDGSVSSDESGILQSLWDLTTDRGATAGLWHCVVFTSGTDAPDYYNDATIHANKVNEDSFNVEPSAIPEFSTVFAGIGVAGLCFGIYWWMRRRVHRVRGVH